MLQELKGLNQENYVYSGKTTNPFSAFSLLLSLGCLSLSGLTLLLKVIAVPGLEAKHEANCSKDLPALLSGQNTLHD